LFRKRPSEKDDSVCRFGGKTEHEASEADEEVWSGVKERKRNKRTGSRRWKKREKVGIGIGKGGTKVGNRSTHRYIKVQAAYVSHLAIL